MPLNLLVRTALDAVLLVALGRLGARTLSWRAALRAALYQTSFAVFLMIPVVGFATLYLAPRFMMRVANVKRSRAQHFALGVALCLVWLSVGLLDQVLVQHTIGPWLEEAFLDWLQRRHRGGF